MAESGTKGPADVSFDFHVIWDRIDGMLTGAVKLLPSIALGIVTFAFFWVCASIVARVIRSSTSSGENKNVGIVVARLSRWGLLITGLLIATTIMIPSVTPGKLIGALGVSSVAIGFAFKDILQNLLAGLLILLKQPFEIGDQIRSGDHEGTVNAVETRATYIKTYDGKRVIIPNSEIYTNAVVVNTAHEARRSQYDIGIGYGDDLRKAVQLVKDTMAKVDGVLKDPEPEVLVTDLAGSSVVLRARWWTEPEQGTVMHVQHEVISAVKEALDDASVDMPYPTNVVLFHNQTEETDGDREKQREGWPEGSNPPSPARRSQNNGSASSTGH